MSMRSIILIGGGGHALVVADAARLAGIEVAGFLDDDAGAALSSEARRLGGLADWGAPGTAGCVLIVALGDLARRRAVIAAVAAAGAAGRFAAVVHPLAAVSRTAITGRGAFIGPGAVVNPRAGVGDHAIINSAAVVEHECDVGENSHIAPGAVLGGGVIVGEGTLVGLGARVLPRIRIGPFCIVGAGAVVTRNVEAGSMVKGLPARTGDEE